MSRIVAQSLFHTAEVRASWRSQTVSALVHGILIVLMFLVAIPVVREARKAAEHVTLIAPQIAAYTPKIQPPHRIDLSRLSVRVIPAVKIPPPLRAVSPPLPAPKAALPEVQQMARIEASPPPQPVKNVETAKAVPVPKIELGGFGDPNAVRASENSRPAPVLMAKVGSFESALGAGESGAGGRSTAGTVKPTAFGSAEGANAGGKSVSNAVHTGGFGETNGAGPGSGRVNAGVKTSGFGETVAAAPAPKLAQATTTAFTPVEILFKPKPSYSPEARTMRVEGQVSLEVVFQASGAVKVVRVIRGLGHGLDEAAQQAALQVRFRPATRAGVAVDQNATISITFELS